VNVKLDAAGAANEIDVYPALNTGLPEPRAVTCTRSGRWVLASTAMATWPTSDCVLLGARVSW
jgi:hypothetical protein